MARETWGETGERPAKNEFGRVIESKVRLESSRIVKIVPRRNERSSGDFFLFTSLRGILQFGNNSLDERHPADDNAASI